ncbi:MAG: DEAD/DEAH box helicase [Burkholderiales bacterium]|nr:DEAD/DEAH box helicase [Burkholderiales bacterium]
MAQACDSCNRTARRPCDSHGSHRKRQVRPAHGFCNNVPSRLPASTRRTPVKTRPSAHLTLKDRLSRLTPLQAQALLGPEGARLLARGGAVDIDIDNQVRFDEYSLRVTIADEHGGPDGIVTVSLDDAHRDRLCIGCTAPGPQGQLYRAAVLSLVLEEKAALGLATAPPQDVPWELLQEDELEARALAEREKRAGEETMKIRSAVPGTPWTDYTVANAASGKTYRVALRGLTRGQSYCSCPDFRKNLLGTCKHVLKVHAWAKRKFRPAQLLARWRPERFAVFARYDGELRLGLEAPEHMSPGARSLAAAWRERFATQDAQMLELLETVRRLGGQGEDVLVYPDAEEILGQVLHRQRVSALVAQMRKDPAAHPLRRELLQVELLPYQLDGVAFAAGRGRAVLADEMGLGKTIQGVGVAELLARHAGIERVLVICPASLKSQWRAEIARFCARSVQLVAGKAAERALAYGGSTFFTICNYEQVLRDFLPIERNRWDLIILDEAQRIKNWEAKTSRVIKSLRSPFALVLTGTPLENRLDELYSVVEFIDERRLGPAYRFIHRHRVASDTGKVLGYRKLESLREHLKPVLLRRTRTSVALELPPRTNEIVRIEPTEEQSDLHNAHMQVVSTITRKRFLTEMDLLRLQKALLLARMSANSTFLVDKKPPGYSSKLERAAELFEALCAEKERKLLVFSEWTTMLDLVEPQLRRLDAGFVRLDGSVPQKRRQQLVSRFQGDPACRVFLTTNAGATGLNLQAADTVVNLDLPWNPALLEQRIARAHRMGQKRPVQVYLLVTEGTIEENLLATLSAKHELAAAVLDPDSDLSEVQLASGMEELKRRLELLLGAKPDAAQDLSVREQAGAAEIAGRRERVAEAGGQLLAAAFSLLGEMLPAASAPAPSALEAVKAGLGQCMHTGEDGKLHLAVTLPDAQALDGLAAALARLLSATAGGAGATGGGAGAPAAAG